MWNNVAFVDGGNEAGMVPRELLRRPKDAVRIPIVEVDHRCRRQVDSRGSWMPVCGGSVRGGSQRVRQHSSSGVSRCGGCETRTLFSERDGPGLDLEFGGMEEMSQR